MNRDDITVDLVRTLVAEQFPRWAALPIRRVQPEGWDNRSFRLGDELSLRLPSAEGYVAQVEKEHRWLPWLRPRLPLLIPKPVARGGPGCGYPWPWSVYRWIEGEPVQTASGVDQEMLARDLAAFLQALHRVDASEGPPPGAHSFHRGGDLRIYDGETRSALAVLDDVIDTDAAKDLWERALPSRWPRSPVWVHGDVATSNLLVRDGRMAAVIDFGCSAVGDPACDLVIAWTHFSGDREAFRSGMPLDKETWARARAWALWKALIWLARDRAAAVPIAPALIATLLADEKASR